MVEINPDAPVALVKAWAAGDLGATFPNTLQRGMSTSRRSMTPRQRQVEPLQHRWPKPRLTGRQAIVELFRLCGNWTKTPETGCAGKDADAMEMKNEMRPYAVKFSEQFSYDVRAEALRILGSGLEIGLAPDDTLNRSDPQPPVELAAQRAECAAILSTTTELRAHLSTRQLPPGAPVSMRGLAILRQREREE